MPLQVRLVSQHPSTTECSPFRSDPSSHSLTPIFSFLLIRPFAVSGTSPNIIHRDLKPDNLLVNAVVSSKSATSVSREDTLLVDVPMQWLVLTGAS